MSRKLTTLALGAALFAGLAASAQAAEVSLARFTTGSTQSRMTPLGHVAL